jgi:hypothetical protein
MHVISEMEGVGSAATMGQRGSMSTCIHHLGGFFQYT